MQNEQADTPVSMRIDIVSDVVCPWCVIGYLQLRRALNARGDSLATDIRWHPFELNPGMPTGGQNLREHLALKAGISAEQSRAARERLTELGESLGFSFRFSDDMRIVNTFAAHQLLHWAREHGKQTELKLALFGAYFRDGEAVDAIDTLARLAASVGLDEAEARQVLRTQRYGDAVRAAERQWVEQGVQGVPAFVFNGRAAVLGAQDAAQFERALQKAA